MDTAKEALDEKMQAAREFSQEFKAAVEKMVGAGASVKTIIGLIGIVTGNLIATESEANEKDKKEIFSKAFPRLIQGVEAGAGISVDGISIRKKAKDNSPDEVTDWFMENIRLCILEAAKMGMPADAMAITINIAAGQTARQFWKAKKQSPKDEIADFIKNIMGGFLHGAGMGDVEVVAAESEEDAEEKMRELKVKREAEKAKKTVH